MWKGIAIVGIWGAVAGVAFAGVSGNAMGGVALCAMLSTLFVAGC